MLRGEAWRDEGYMGGGGGELRVQVETPGNDLVLPRDVFAEQRSSTPLLVMNTDNPRP